MKSGTRYKLSWKTWTLCPSLRRWTKGPLAPVFLLRVPLGISFMGYPPVFFLRVSPVLSLRVCPGTAALIGFPRVPMGSPHGTLWVLPCTFVRGTVAPQPFGLVPELGYSPPQRSDFIKERSRPPSFFHTLVCWDLLGFFPFSVLLLHLAFRLSW